MANEPNKKAKTRRVKNPESFRQKAEKASTATPKKHELRRVASPVTRPIGKASKKVSRPLKKAGGKVAGTKAGRALKKPVKLLGIILLIPYLRGSWRELKQVTWPSWKQSWRLTYAVLAFAVVFGATIAGLDWVLAKIFKQILIK